MIKKICFFTTHFDFPRQRYLDYFEDILPKNVEIFLFYSEKSKIKFTTKRAKVGFAKNKFTLPLELRRFCRKNKIDVIMNLSGLSEMAFSTVFSSLLTNQKIIFQFTTNLNPKYQKGLGFLFLKYFHKRLKNYSFLFWQFFISRFLVSAEDVTQKTKRLLFFSKNKIFHVPLTVNTSVFKLRNKEECRKKHNLNKKDKIIVFVGRVEYLKGSDFMLKLIKANPDKKFVLIGQVRDKRFKNLKLDNLILPGTKTKDELAEYYACADLFLFLSRVEGFGLAPREAMACGTPTLVSDIESLRLISPALKSQFDLKKIQEKIEYFFNLSASQKKHLSSESREFVINECSREKVKEAYLNHLLDFR
jgi:glycosyltransferase involved in cell wall biosynthesis